MDFSCFSALECLLYGRGGARRGGGGGEAEAEAEAEARRRRLAAAARAAGISDAFIGQVPPTVTKHHYRPLKTNY